MSATPVLVLICASIFLFTGRYKEYAPSIKYLDFKYFHDLIGLGTRFFVMQISAVIILSTDNIIISQLFDPSMVTPYNVAYKYFSIITLIFITVLLTPYWSAYTDAYAKKEFDWIRKETKKLIKIWLVLIVVVVLMVFASNTIYRIWIGKIITVPFVLSVTMGLYVIIFSWNSIFAGFINGTGKIQLRMYSAILAGVINIPLSIYFVKFLDMGISGVIVATCVCLMADSILAPLQYLKLIRQTAKGIWDR
jgi:O-antigen/teichoic acid export membrane protein